MEQQNNSQKNSIRDVLQHPQVTSHINRGLSGLTFVDNVIGAVEQARHQNPGDAVINLGYEALRSEYPRCFQAYPEHFQNSATPYLYAQKKPDAYKARGVMNS